MNEIEKQIKSIFTSMDKSSWQIFKFEDIAFNISERVDPAQTDAEIYVGLEHIDSDSIHIRRYGVPGDVKGTKLKVYKEDVIFGKRRAYQRKAAIAHFDGICSAHAMVLRANSDNIDTRFFPFFVHSDVFMTKALEISEGSLSPTIKWNILKKQEFKLPPMQLQQKISQLLEKIDLYVESLIVLKESTQTLLEVKIAELIWENGLTEQPLESISKLEKKLQDGDWIESKDMSPSGIRLLQLADIGENIFINKSKKYISDETFERLNCFEVLPGDLLLARMPEPIGRTCEVLDTGNRMITAVDCCIIRVDEKNNDKRFCLYLLNSHTMREKILKLASGSTRQRISTSNLKKISIPKPEKNTQKEISDKLDVIRDNLSRTDSLISDANKLSATLLRKVL